MPMFRPRSTLQIEAIQFLGVRADEAGRFDSLAETIVFAGAAGRFERGQLFVRTVDGECLVDPGDWLVRDASGALAVRHADVFAAQYEPVPPRAPEPTPIEEIA